MRIDRVDGIEQLHWQQDVTLKNVDEFRAAVTKLAEGDSAKLIVDLSEVAYLNSAALGVIADAVLQAGRLNKQLVIAGARAAVAEIFAIVRFGTFMHIFGSTEEAYAFYNKAEG